MGEMEEPVTPEDFIRENMTHTPDAEAVAALVADAKRLREALLGVASFTKPELCWCDDRLPEGHSGYCIEARAALEGGRG